MKRVNCRVLQNILLILNLGGAKLQIVVFELIRDNAN